MEWRDWLLWALLASGLLDIIPGLLLPNDGRIVGFGNSNLTGGHLALLAPLTITAWRKWPRARWLLAACIVGAGVVFVGTQSRGGALSLLTVAAALLLLGKKSLVVSVVACGLALAIAILQLPVGAASTVQRFYLWKLALDCWRSYPWWGIGLGQFEGVCRASAGSIPLFNPAWCIHPHNTPLRILAEAGIAGEAGVVVTLAIVEWALILRWRVADRARRQELAIYIASLAGVIPQSLIDDLLYFPHYWLTVVSLAILALEG